MNATTAPSLNMRRYFGIPAEDFGIKGDGSDETAKLQALFDASADEKLPGLLPLGITIKTRGLRSNKKGSSLKSMATNTSWRTHAPTLRFEGTPLYKDRYGRTIALPLNMPGEDNSSQDNVSLSGIRLQEIGRKFDIGVYGHYAASVELKYLTSVGFGTPFKLARMWYSNFDNLSIWWAREFGFSIYDAELRGDSGATKRAGGVPDNNQKHNGVNIGYVHVNSGKETPIASFDFRAAFSVHAGVLTSEKRQGAHIMVSPRTTSLAIDTLHGEGASHCFLIDGDWAKSNIDGGNISIRSGFVDHSHKSGKRFVGRTSGASKSQIHNLDIGNLVVRSSDNTDYFDLSNVRNFRCQGEMYSSKNKLGFFGATGLMEGHNGNKQNPVNF